MTMYLEMPIQPHLNHLIWLSCAVVIARCAFLTSLGPLTASNGVGKDPLSFLRQMQAMTVNAESSTLLYLRTMLVVVSVYSLTGQSHPVRPCMIDFRNA